MPRAAARPPEPVAPPLRERESVLGRIRLRHLQCFLSVAQFANLRRAAVALSISQPAVTKTLRELEELLGKPLFLRGRHGASLTAEGMAFLRPANDTLSALGQAVDSVRREPSTAPLHVGALPTVAPALLARALQSFAVSNPSVVVRVVTGRNAELIAALRRRELDAVIGRLSDPELMLGLSFEHLYAEPLVIVVRAGHPMRTRTRTRARGAAPVGAPAALASIGRYPFVLPPAGTLIRQVADGFLQRHGVVTACGAIETLDTSLARALALSGDNLWFTPLGAAAPDLTSGALVRLEVDLTPEESVGLILRTEPIASLNLQQFVANVRAAAAHRPASPKQRPMVGSKRLR